MAKAKHAGGRPTVATPENVNKAWEYVVGGYQEAEEHFPTVEGLALWLNISKDTLYVRDEFSDVLEKLKNLQARELIKNGIMGTYSPVITKLLLASKHGYVEKSAQEHTGKDGSPLFIVDMNKSGGEDEEDRGE